MRINNFTFYEIPEGENFDPSVIYANAPLTQARFYGEWQKQSGREARRFSVKKDNEIVAYFQLIKYPLIWGKNYFYIPYGPIVKNFSEELIIALKQALLEIVKNDNIVFVRLDFTPASNEPETALLKKTFHKAPLFTYHSAYFQPREEWFLKLNKSEEDILKNIHQKTRYSIKVAERKGIKTEIIDTDIKNYFEIFYQLMNETAKRNNFNIHPRQYYKNIFDNVDKNKNAYLSIAKYQDEILVIGLIVIFAGVAHHIFAGSSDQYRNLRPSYLAHWTAFCYAKKAGCVYYNFGAVASDNKADKQWDNLSDFKRKFGGQAEIHSKFYDLVIQPFYYYLYNLRKFIK
ncbi:MAG: peptidoglycan bridge formation glycyltransferase FemA/FemB family protein [Patescibacteria group bacterium]